MVKTQTEINYEMKLLSSLDKVFQDETPVYRPECMKLSALWGETVSYQAAYTGDFFMRERLEVQVVSEIADAVRVRTVEQVPVGRATNGIVDEAGDHAYRVDACRLPGGLLSCAGIF